MTNVDAFLELNRNGLSLSEAPEGGLAVSPRHLIDERLRDLIRRHRHGLIAILRDGLPGWHLQTGTHIPGLADWHREALGLIGVEP